MPSFYFLCFLLAWLCPLSCHPQLVVRFWLNLTNFDKNKLHWLAKSEQDHGYNIFCGLRALMEFSLHTCKALWIKEGDCDLSRLKEFTFAIVCSCEPCKAVQKWSTSKSTNSLFSSYLAGLKVHLLPSSSLQSKELGMVYSKLLGRNASFLL